MKDNLHLITGCDDGHIYKVKMVEPLRPSEFRAHGLGVSSMAMSKDEKYLISGSNDDTVAIWNAKTFQNLHRMEGSMNVLSVAISTDD